MSWSLPGLYESRGQGRDVLFAARAIECRTRRPALPGQHPNGRPDVRSYYGRVELDCRLANMRMVERSDAPGFALESFAELLIRSFDGNDAIEPGVAGSVHFSHSASAPW